MIVMSRDENPGRGPEWPRSEPEILTPGRASRGPAGLFVRIEERDGVRRVFIARPGLPSIILALLIIGLIAAIVFLVLAGVVLVWIPVLIIGIVLALLSGAIRYRWQRLQAWWTGTR
jgi:Flp pilus assembly protein TadB